MKSDLEVTIKATDSKHVEIFSVIESADSKRKKNGTCCSAYWGEKPGIPTNRCETKTVAGNLVFFYYRENDLLNQEIRTIRALDELDFFSIDDDETKLFESSAEISINDYPELFDFDFSQFLKRFDFSSILIFAFTAFQK